MRCRGLPLENSTLISQTLSHTVNPAGYLARKASTLGFGNGASGGPWFYKYDKSMQLGCVLGDTGGYQDGGSSDSPSYSPFWTVYFGGFVDAVSMEEKKAKK